MSRLDELIAEYCPDGVEYRSFGEIAEIIRGASPRPIKNFITTDKQGVNWIKIGDVKQGEKYITKTEEKITPDGAQKSRFVQPGDFILSNSMSFGRPYVLKTSGCIHDGWLAIRNYQRSFNTDFLYHLLNSNDIQTEMKKRASFGGAVQNLNADIVRALVLPVPPLPVQCEIVRILDNFTELTEALTAELSKEVTCLGEQQKYYLNKLVSSANDYETKLLRELVSVKMCKRIKKDQTVSEGGVPFYKNGTLGRKADSYIPLELYEEYLQRYPFPQKGAVMLSTAGTVGRAYIYDGKPAYFQDSNVVWLENDETVISNEYLYWFCTSMPWKLPTRGTIKHLHNDMILDTPITIPPREAQEEFVGFLKNSINRFSEIHDCLLSEIDARQKQYVYYREKLLTFKEKT